jgi:hypothetical protein
MGVDDDAGRPLRVAGAFEGGGDLVEADDLADAGERIEAAAGAIGKASVQSGP